MFDLLSQVGDGGDESLSRSPKRVGCDLRVGQNSRRGRVKDGRFARQVAAGVWFLLVGHTTTRAFARLWVAAGLAACG